MERKAELRVQIGNETPVRTGVHMTLSGFSMWCHEHKLQLDHNFTSICEPPLDDWLARMPGRSVTFWLSFPRENEDANS